MREICSSAVDSRGSATPSSLYDLPENRRRRHGGKTRRRLTPEPRPKGVAAVVRRAIRVNQLGSDESSGLANLRHLSQLFARLHMPNYYVNRNEQSDGYHEVHIDDGSCPYPPQIGNRLPLGYHPNCASAVAAAKTVYPKSDGCYWCIPTCHTR